MTLLTVSLIGFSLSLDTFSVSAALGIKERKKSLAISVIFSFFHFLMPVLGYYLGSLIGKFFSEVDHWLAFFLLFFVGLKIILEPKKKCLDKFQVFCVAFATSVDAFIIGITFSFLDFPIFSSALIISFINFLITLSGFFLSKFLRKFSDKWSNFVAGLILVVIGFKILFDHLKEP